MKTVCGWVAYSAAKMAKYLDASWVVWREYETAAHWAEMKAISMVVWMAEW